MFDITGIVSGTPRTYGHLRNDSAWCDCVVRGQWSDIHGLSLPLREAVRVDFRFRVNPGSADYGGHVSPNGRDLDTMVLQDSTMGALTVHRSRRPSLQIIESPARCALVTAEKTLVTSDSAAGVDIRIRSLPDLNSFLESLPAADLRIQVPRSAVRSAVGLPAAIEQATEEANRTKQLALEGTARIGLVVQFAVAAVPKNVCSAGYLEAAVDALGNSRVGSRRLFDEDRFNGGRGIRNTDDSIVFKLICANHATMESRPFVEFGIYPSTNSLELG